MSYFGDLVNIEDFWEKRKTFETERWEVSFYCKECENIVEVTREKPKSYNFTCNDCGAKNIVIWTHAGIKDTFFRKKF